MYRTNVARLLLERHMASFRHNRLILLARVAFACQVIFKLPFATLTLSIVFGYHAAFSSIHPFLVYFSMAFLFCLYTIGLYQTSILSGFKVNPVLFIRGGRHLREKHVPMCVLILLALHLMSFMVTYNGIRSDIMRAEVLKRFSTDDSLHEFQGLVISKEKESDQYCSYIFRISGGVKMLLYTNPDTELICGQGIEVIGKVNAFSGVRNPGGFDSAKYNRSKGVFYAINIHKEPIVVTHPSILRKGLNYAFQFSEMIRDDMVLFWEKIFGEEKAGFLSAVIFGLKDGMNYDLKSAMRKSNLSHLVSVSGLHVSMIIAPIISVISMTGIDRNRKKVICVVALLLLGFLTGYSPSVSRAVLMNILSILNAAMNRKNSPFNNLCFSSLILLYISPYYVGNLGFVLSFSATFGIIMFSKKFANHFSQIGVTQFISTSLATFCAAQIGMLPVLIQMSGRQSVVLIIIALIAALPAQGICFSIFPSSILALIFDRIFSNIIFAKIFLLPSYILLDILAGLSSIGQKAYFSATALRDMPRSWIIAAIVVSTMFLQQRKNTVRILILCASVLIFVGGIEFASSKKDKPIATLIISDVGQGDCIILLTETRCIVIDGGDENNGERVLLPLLDYYGIYKPDLTLLTHLHRDHFAGLLEAANHDRIRRIGTPYFQTREELSVQDDDQWETVDFFEVRAGSELRISDTVTFRILSPQRPTENGGNEDSLVILMQVNDFSALLMGDSGFATEQTIMNEHAQLFENLGEIDLLKIGHHGSKYSTSDAFLEMIDPSYAVVSVGNNYFGHPSSDAMHRIEHSGAEIFRTDYDGAVIVYVYNNHYKVETMLG